MRTLILASTLPRYAGDMQANFVGEQAAAWAAARPKDEIFVLAPHHAGAARHEQIGAIDVERFRYFLPEEAQRLAYPAILPNIRRNPLLAAQLPAFLLAEYGVARRRAKQARIDCVYAHWIMPQGLVAWALKRRLGIPYILQNHSSDLAVFGKAGEPGRRLARAVLREAAHFFCVNAKQRDEALALFNGRERADFASRCTVLPMGIAELPRLSNDDCENGYDIATIGRLSRKKGLNYLIEAAELLAKKGIRPRMGIAGDGEDRAALRALVRNADVAFPGFLVGGEKEAFLESARRFAFPAKASKGDVEGLPVALLEALARGRPVLASSDTNIALLPEWSEIREAVVFVDDPADVPALARGLEQLLDCDRGAAPRAAEIIARYRWDRLIEEYLQPIEAALGRQGSVRA